MHSNFGEVSNNFNTKSPIGLISNNLNLKIKVSIPNLPTLVENMKLRDNFQNSQSDSMQHVAGSV